MKTYNEFKELLSEVALPKTITDPVCAAAAKEINAPGGAIDTAWDDATKDLGIELAPSDFIRFSPRYGSLITNKKYYKEAKPLFDNGAKGWKSFLKILNKGAEEAIDRKDMELRLGGVVASKWWSEMMKKCSKRLPMIDGGAFDRDGKMESKYNKILAQKLKETRMKSPLKQLPPLGLINSDVVSNINDEKDDWFDDYTSEWGHIGEDLFFSPSQGQWCWGGGSKMGPWEMDYKYPNDDPEQPALDDPDGLDGKMQNDKYLATWDAFISNMKNRTSYFSDLPKELKGTEKQCMDYFNKVCDYNYKNGPTKIDQDVAEDFDDDLYDLFADIDGSL